jgi:NAD-dependent DNA ligase
MSQYADYQDYSRFTDRQETDKAFHTLEGILKGINIDQNINHKEIKQLKKWCIDHYHYVKRPPFNEAISLILSATDDGIITEEEHADISWLCNNIITPNKYYNAITADIQRLFGIIHGIISDNVITKEELIGLKEWINDHADLMGSYPYDEIEALLYHVLDDGKVTDEEQSLLKVYFSQFVDIKNTVIPQEEIELLRKSITIPSICTLNANISFDNKLFCFTGISSKGKRIDVAEKIISMGGQYNDTMTNETNYLIIGDRNNPCWVFSCYGRKVEKAIENRQKGLPIQIVKEVDFWDEADSR